VPGWPASRCSQHKREGHISRPSSLCGVCRSPATHGLRYPERCELHRRDGDANLVERPCAACGLPERLDEAKGLCDLCRAGPRVRLAKQLEVRNALAERLPEWPWDCYDRTPSDLRACGDRERPDFFWDRHAWAVVLEVDEHQHWSRPEECECARMVNMAQALGVPTYFVRFNPDAYRPAGSAPAEPLRRRFDVLLRWLRAALREEPMTARSVAGTGAAVLRLFFDGHEARWLQIEHS
jgi:hypothetical protein